MACSIPHIVDEIKAMVQKQIEEDKVRQLAIMNLAVEYDNASTAKDDLRKTYEECNDIPQERRSLIDTFLKEESDKCHEMHNALYILHSSPQLVFNLEIFHGFVVQNFFDHNTSLWQNVFASCMHIVPPKLVLHGILC
ncbi:hypothetical protein Tco_1063028 [Tanacetum coccineum]